MSSSHPTVIVFGSGGLLGRHVVNEYARAGEPVLALSHGDLDVTSESSVIKLLDRENPSVVINCAALCHFQGCEDHPELSERVNLHAPVQLAGWTAERGIRLVHFSTDYIFDGNTNTPYREGDAPRPLSVYGTHKAEVEAAFTVYSEQHLLLRVAWLFGKGGKTFLSMLPDLVMRQSRLEVASGKRGSCLHVGYAAQVIRQLLAQNTTGLLNLVHSGEASWEGFAHECLRQLQARGYEPACRDLIEVPMDKMPVLGGSRPIYSVLEVNKLARELGTQPMEWQAGLSQFLDATYPAGTPILA